MSDTPETDAAELIYDGIVASGYADADVCRKLERERDQARRELDIQLESIHFHMERVPVREHSLRADDAPLQDSGAEPQPLREGEPSDFCGAIRRMRDAEKERDEARKALQRLADCDWVITLPDRMDAVRKIARDALEAAK